MLVSISVHYRSIVDNESSGNKSLEDAVVATKIREIKSLEEEGMCAMGQVKPGSLKQVFSKLVPYENTNNTKEPQSDEDIRTGYKLFHVIVYCPTMVFKLFRFVDKLLSVETKRNSIQTFVSLFQV